MDGLYKPNIPTYNIEWIRMFLKEKHGLIQIVDFLESLKLPHHYCDDCFYSCPKSEEGSCDDKAKELGVCNCGADAHNERIQNFIERLKS